MELIIFEKPKQARSACSAFGFEDKKSHLVLKPQSTFPNGAIAVYCVGHIMESARPADINPTYKEWKLEHLPMDLISYENETKMKQFPMKVSKATKSAFEEIKKWVNDSRIKGIIHAGDCARNGQLIVDEVLIYLKNKKPVRRLWVNSLEASAVRKAFKNLKPNEEYYSYYEEALARQQSDYIIGMNGSRLITILMESKGLKGGTVTNGESGNGYNLGRVQCPTLRVLTDRDRAITNFKPTPFYELQGMFEKESISFLAMYDSEGERITDKEQALNIANYMSGKDGFVDIVEEKPVSEEPPLFFNLTSLIAEVNKRTQQSPEEILDVAQELYTKGFLSYPRVDPVVVNPEEAANFPETLQLLQANGWGANYLPAPIQEISHNKRYTNSDLTDDHYAITPTLKVPKKDELDTLQRVMYQLVSDRLITAHYPPAVYQMTKASILVDDEFSFHLKEKRLEQLGWKATLKKDTSSEPSAEDESSQMPVLVEGDLVLLKQVNVLDKMTTAPKRFTQGQLPTVMENISAYLSAKEKEGLSKDNLSLGTSATRSGIIKQLMVRNYIQVKENNIYVQPKGFLLIDALGPDSWIASPRTTGIMEQYLTDIGNKIKPAPPFVRRTQTLVNELIVELKEKAPTWQFEEKHVEAFKEQSPALISIGKCLICGGEVVDKGKFYGCMNYKEQKCSFSISKNISGQTITKKQAELILTTQRTNTLSKFKKKGKDEFFSAQLVWDDTKRTLIFDFVKS